MSPRNVFTIGAVIALVFGVAFLLAPSTTMALYGLAYTPPLAVAFRYFGVALVTAFCLVWPVRACEDPSIVRPLLLGHALADALGVVVSVWATASGTLNALGWLNVAIYAGLLAAAAYLASTFARRPLAAA